MATKKAKAATSGRKPRTRKAAEEGDDLRLPGDDAGETKVAALHDSGQRAIEEGTLVEGAGNLAEMVVRQAASDEQADEIINEVPESSLSSVLLRALRFSTKDSPFVLAYPNIVIGTGPRGSTYVPWQAAGLAAGGHAVDGRRLYRFLRAVGGNAQLEARGDGGIVVHGGSRRFTLAPVTGAMPAIPLPQAPAWVVVDPSRFAVAAKFTGDDKIEPPHLAGVHIRHGAASATDRRGLAWVPNFTDQSAIVATLPRDAFDGIGDRCYLAIGDQGHAFVADPATGEYRALVTWGLEFPDVAKVVQRAEAVFAVHVDQQALISTIKHAWIVQSRISSLKLWVFANAEGHWLEVRAGDPMATAEFVSRLGVRIVGAPPSDPFKVAVSGGLLMKLAQSAVGNEVRIGFGQTDQGYVSLRDAPHSVVVMPMTA